MIGSLKSVFKVFNLVKELEKKVVGEGWRKKKREKDKIKGMKGKPQKFFFLEALRGLALVLLLVLLLVPLLVLLVCLPLFLLFLFLLFVVQYEERKRREEGKEREKN